MRFFALACFVLAVPVALALPVAKATQAAADTKATQAAADTKATQAAATDGGAFHEAVPGNEDIDYSRMNLGQLCGSNCAQ